MRETIELSPADRRTLEDWVRGKGALRAPMTVDDRRPLEQRSAIILAYADGEKLGETIRRLNTSEYVVLFWRKRFKQFGPQGLVTKMGRPRQRVALTAAERRTLLEWQRGAGAAAAALNSTQREVLAERASIILASANDEPNNAIASRLGLALRSVQKWRNRFSLLGIDGLLGKGDSGYAFRHGSPIPQSIEDRIRELGTNQKLSTYEIARAVGVSQMTVSRTLRNARKSRSGEPGNTSSTSPRLRSRR